MVITAEPGHAVHRSWLRRVPIDVWPVIVLFLFTVLLWGNSALGHFDSRLLASPGDSKAFEFNLAWEAHAIVHLSNPFFTSSVYAPMGQSVGSGIPVFSVALLCAPVTLLFGATAGYNTAMLAGIFLAAAATYLLARELFRSLTGALMAGLLIVVSPYMAGHGYAHLNLIWIWGFPFLGFLAVRYFNGGLGAVWVGVGAAVAAAFTLGASAELFVTETLFSVVAWLVAFLFASKEQRERVVRAGVWVLVGGAVGVVIASPVIYSAVHAGLPSAQPNPPALYSSDLTNLVAPTPLSALGSAHFLGLESHWFGNGAENTAYLPFSLLIALIALAAAWRRSRLARGLLTFTVVAFVCSLGPLLTIDGYSTIWMPWQLTQHIPLLKDALPARFSAFVFVAVAVAVAGLWSQRWLARPVTVLLVVISVVLLWPHLAQFKAGGVPVYTAKPQFIADETLKRLVSPDANVLVLPPGEFGPGLEWIEQSDFYFRMPTGNGGGATPPPAFKNPTGFALYAYATDPVGHYDWKHKLPPYLRHLGVHTVLVGPQATPWVETAQSAFGRGRLIDGVWVFRVR